MGLSTWNKTGNILNFWFASNLAKKKAQQFYPGRNYAKGKGNA